jgi:hypothetical protein
MSNPQETRTRLTQLEGALQPLIPSLMGLEGVTAVTVGLTDTALRRQCRPEEVRPEDVAITVRFTSRAARRAARSTLANLLGSLPYHSRASGPIRGLGGSFSSRNATASQAGEVCGSEDAGTREPAL